MDRTIKEKRPVLIYDKDCPICRKAAHWVERNKRGDVLELLPCQAEAVRDRFPFMKESVCMKGMQLILPDGRVLPGEKALPEIINMLRRYRWVAWLFRLPGSGILSHAFYRWFAERRYRIAKIFSPKETKTRARDRRVSGYVVPRTGFRKIQHFF
jgi:predicted DCC family thiol-disulfide oxidoreductase YuxK